jgi:hypothetical protein
MVRKRAQRLIELMAMVASLCLMAGCSGDDNPIAEPAEDAGHSPDSSSPSADASVDSGPVVESCGPDQWNRRGTCFSCLDELEIDCDVFEFSSQSDPLAMESRFTGTGFEIHFNDGRVEFDQLELHIVPVAPPADGGRMDPVWLSTTDIRDGVAYLEVVDQIGFSVGAIEVIDLRAVTACSTTFETNGLSWSFRLGDAEPLEPDNCENVEIGS